MNEPVLHFRVNDERIEIVLHGEVVDAWTFNEATARAVWLIQIASPVSCYAGAVMSWETSTGTHVPVSRPIWTVHVEME